MPIKPFRDLFPETDSETKKALKKDSDIIREVFNAGCGFFKGCYEAGGSNIETLISLLHFYHGLAILDAISVLVGVGIFEPTKILLRGLLETTFSSKYMLQNDTKTRAWSFLLCAEHKEIEWLKKTDPNSTQGATFIQRLQKDKTLNHFRLPQVPDLQKKLDEFDKRFNSAEFQHIEKEFQTVKNLHPKKKALPEWYTLFSGRFDPSTNKTTYITSISQLADAIGCSALYEVCYRYYSEAVHGSDIIKGKIVTNEDGSGTMAPIRNSQHGNHVVGMTLNLGLLLIETMVNYFIPKDKPIYDEWYVAEIRPHRGFE
ncbi:MAG: DUF5677 domain-containing protein [Blastocatellia bacterium]